MFSFLFVIVYIAYTVIMMLKFDAFLLIPVWLISGLLVSFLVIVIILLLLFPVLKFTRYQNKFKSFIIQSAARFANQFLLNLTIETVGIENIPKEGNTVIYGNHKSMADPLIVLDFIKKPLAFTPKKSLYKIPLLSNVFNYMGCFPIDRESDRNTARALVQAIKNVSDGLWMMVFPEGGIKDRDDDQMREMRAGAYKLAVKAEANILPITIIGASEIHKRSPLKETQIKVIIHKPILRSELLNMSTHDIADMVFNIINEPLLHLNER